MATSITNLIQEGDPTAFRISHLCELLEDYLEPDQIAEVYRAYLFGAEAHDGQSRKTGEPYIYHPVAVAKILAEMRMDPKSLIAALLHDVIEDTETAKEQLSNLFGEEVAELVDGVSKLDSMEFESKLEAQAENFRKMMLAMTRDIRVILVKLADRLHNMRTLSVMRPEKRRRIARETLDIYSPIANRLGMNSTRLELEELGFEAAYPLRFRVLNERMRKARGNRKEIVTKIERSIKERLKMDGLDGHVVGREKHLYGIYNKMRTKHLPFTEVMDVYAFRITVDSVDMCYRILGAVHNLYKPVPGKFKDYIAIPKVNGYQSLHTVLFSPYGVPIEVQIRTEDMDKVAEAGIAAHWLYKSGDDTSGNSAQVRARQWLLDVLEIQQHAGNSMEFLENVKIDLFPDEVYVFSPRGDIMELPRGATAVDFAYSVHTDVGNRCVAVKIDRHLMPLRTELRNGQTIEIITSPAARPNPVWLNFVQTAKARSNIRHFLKNLQKDEAIQLGERLLNRSLEEFNTTIKDLPKKNVLHVLKSFKYKTMEHLLAEVGLGNRMPLIMARMLAEDDDKLIDQPGKHDKERKTLVIKGTEGTVVSYAKCCRPIPGDEIIGFVTAGRGIVIHTNTCNNVADFRSKPEKWIDVDWEEDVEGEFPVELRTLVVNQRGVLARVAAEISDVDANIENVEMSERDGQHSSLTFTVTVKNRKHLARIMRQLRTTDIVLRISRIHK